MTKPVISMDEFGPISADWFIARRVEEVRDSDQEDATWEIVFEGGGRIINFDKRLKKPKAIVGAALTLQILGSSDENRQPQTLLRFDLEEVKLNPTKWAMYDTALTRGMVVYAQASDYNVPDHPEGRTAEGPDEKWQRQREAAEKARLRRLAEDDQDRRAAEREQRKAEKEAAKLAKQQDAETQAALEAELEEIDD